MSLFVLGTEPRPDAIPSLNREFKIQNKIIRINGTEENLFFAFN